jgi:hypothetical protein
MKLNTKMSGADNMKIIAKDRIIYKKRKKSSEKRRRHGRRPRIKRIRRRRLLKMYDRI